MLSILKETAVQTFMLALSAPFVDLILFSFAWFATDVAGCLRFISLVMYNAF